MRKLMLIATLLASGCAEGEGIVELYWQFEDDDLRRIYPQGESADTCEFTSASGTRYDLRVRLSIIENSQACADDPGNADCQVIEPVLFPCNRARGTADPVPISAEQGGSDPGYLMFVDAVIDPSDGPAFVPNAECLIGPGPRVRKVRPGRITDLEVVQFIVSAVTVDDYTLDLDACR